jgi:hypothetical protein
MRSEIMHPKIRLNFHNLSDSHYAALNMDEVFAEQFPSDHNCVSVVE